MCAPIMSADPLRQEGAQVIGALEVEARYGQEFKAYEEEQLSVMAGVVAGLLVLDCPLSLLAPPSSQRHCYPPLSPFLCPARQ